MIYKPPTPEPIQRLRRDEEGTPLATPDAQGVPRYLYTDGTVDPLSTVNEKAGYVLAVFGCEPPPTEAEAPTSREARKADPETYQAAAKRRQEAGTKYGKSVVNAAVS